MDNKRKMENMRRVFLIASFIIFIAVLIFYGVFLLLAPTRNKTTKTFVPHEEQAKSGIVVYTPQPNVLVSSPLKIIGYVNGDGWIGFEGQVGTVKLLDSTGKELGLAVLTAKGEWTQTKIDFETQMNFVSTEEQNGSLVFHNENPSGDPQRDKTFTLPVKLPKMETTKVKLYFNNSTLNADYTCEHVYPIERDIKNTAGIAKATLEELLVGPTLSERDVGFSTNINPGVKVQNLVIENGMAKVDFSGELNANVAGTCRVNGIKAQITETLKQFPTIKDVVISVNGNSKNILQP